MNLVLHPTSADRYVPTSTPKPKRRGTNSSAQRSSSGRKSPTSPVPIAPAPAPPQGSQQYIQVSQSHMNSGWSVTTCVAAAIFRSNTSVHWAFPRLFLSGVSLHCPTAARFGILKLSVDEYLRSAVRGTPAMGVSPCSDFDGTRFAVPAGPCPTLYPLAREERLVQ